MTRLFGMRVVMAPLDRIPESLRFGAHVIVVTPREFIDLGQLTGANDLVRKLVEYRRSERLAGRER